MLFFLIFRFISSNANESTFNASSSFGIMEALRFGNKFTDIVDTSIFVQFPEFESDKFLKILNHISVPKRSCYNEILYHLQFDCEEANDEQQKTLALHFTQCYYNVTGKLDQFPSGPIDNLKTSQMSTAVYSVYTSMKAHWKNLCLFSKQNVFTEETSQSLVDLYSTIVESMHSIISLQKELNATSILLNDSLMNITTQLNKTIDNVNKIQVLFESFTGYFDIVKTFIDYSVDTLHQIQFYAIVIIIAFFFALYLPKMLVPVTLLTILFSSIDNFLGKRVLMWNDSIYRTLTKIVYSMLCFSYPTIQIIYFLIGLTKRIINLFKNDSKIIHESKENSRKIE
ncbi:hypothetical protein TRFO_10984 [Tritrichomonas foetus]|uniref:Uncharacterized protein n=1 Tax=Tritrichomonas foetus TaxID=1144522 RepID=A0A1J4JAE6_9EUKA|nr:hypothetical protein TRFO_10984 [Tritrichomonas foetus]|eukprot:OHS94611.1 hypothetical protein TRFO_10984 [Tritrichomonas foetus]